MMRLKFTYQPLGENATLMLLNQNPFCKITEQDDGCLMIRDDEGNFIENEELETFLLEQFVIDHIEDFPGTQIYRDYHAKNITKV